MGSRLRVRRKRGAESGGLTGGEGGRQDRRSSHVRFIDVYTHVETHERKREDIFAHRRSLFSTTLSPPLPPRGRGEYTRMENRGERSHWTGDWSLVENVDETEMLPPQVICP